MTTPASRTPRSLKQLRAGVATAMLLCGLAVAGVLTTSMLQVRAAATLAGQAGQADQARLALATADYSATAWAVDRRDANKSEFDGHIKDATAALADLPPGTDPSAAEVIASVVAYGQRVQSGFDASANTSAGRALTAHQGLTTGALADLSKLADRGFDQATALVPAAWAVHLIHLLALVVLVIASVLLALRTRRVLNVGLVAAVALTIGGWVLAGSTIGSPLGASADLLASAQTAAGVEVRVHLTQAMAAENLALATQDAAGHEQAWQQHLNAAERAAGQTTSPIKIRGVLDELESKHDEVIMNARAGYWKQAIGLATGPSGTRKLLDAVLDTVPKDDPPKRATTSLNSNADSLTAVSVGAVLAALAAGVSAVAGINQRLREYR